MRAAFAFSMLLFLVVVMVEVEGWNWTIPIFYCNPPNGITHLYLKRAVNIIGFSVADSYNSSIIPPSDFVDVAWGVVSFGQASPSSFECLSNVQQRMNEWKPIMQTGPWSEVGGILSSTNNVINVSIYLSLSFFLILINLLLFLSIVFISFVSSFPSLFPWG